MRFLLERPELKKKAQALNSPPLGKGFQTLLALALALVAPAQLTPK